MDSAFFFQNKLYVYNTDTKDFVRLDQYSSRYIYKSGSISEMESDLGTDAKRLKLTNGTMTSVSNPIFNSFTISEGNIELTENKLLQLKNSMKFETNAKGDSVSTVNNNSGYGLLDSYKAK